MPTDDHITGDSSALTELQRAIARAASVDAPVLVFGESGAGKAFVAREIHTRGARRERPFVRVNCAGVPGTLLESELFGHKKGSFTGAYGDKAGRLASAQGGTVFLAEVGEMPPRIQHLVLRVIETGAVARLGAEQAPRNLNVRVIAATSRSLKELVAGGLFREDLFSRLNAIQLVVPPLRRRREDIKALAGRFLRQFTETHRSPVEAIAPAALDALMAYSWPGNVRELELVIERLVIVGRAATVQLADLPLEMRTQKPAAPDPAPAADVVDALYGRLTRERESFWTTVYPLYMQREITRNQVRDVVRKGLEEARGNYKIMVELFNMEAGDYKKFLNFLRKHQCQLPFKDYRQVSQVEQVGRH